MYERLEKWNAMVSARTIKMPEREREREKKRRMRNNETLKMWFDLIQNKKKHGNKKISVYNDYLEIWYE